MRPSMLLLALLALALGALVFLLARPAIAARTTQPTLESLMTTPSPAAGEAAVAGPRVSRAAHDITPLTPERVEQLAAKLTDEERRILLKKGTEPAFCGTLLDNKLTGTYVCRLCHLPLFSSSDKFNSGTGWPSFFQPYDAEHIAYVKDTSHGMTRVEILCTRCSGHLGHVFDDGPEPTGLRYCLNSASLDFVEKGQPWPEGAAPITTKVAYFGGGCFWGVEDRFQRTTGVVNAVSGYMGGSVANPTYKQVSYEDTGHAEVVAVTYDPARTTYAQLLERFFKYHDPTQLNRQGPDVGEQYRSVIFAADAEQYAEAKRFVESQQTNARFRGRKVVTQVVGPTDSGPFYLAEDYHQDYNERTGHVCPMPEE